MTRAVVPAGGRGSPELPVPPVPPQVSEGAVLLVQPGGSLHFPAVEHLRGAVCSRALAGTVLPACPGDTAVTACITSGVAGECCPAPRTAGASGDSTTVPPLPAPAPALRAVTPGLVISGLVRDVTLCSSSSISTTLRHPGLLPRQQHRLHGGAGAGRAAAGAAQTRPLAGLLWPQGVCVQPPARGGCARWARPPCPPRARCWPLPWWHHHHPKHLHLTAGVAGGSALEGWKCPALPQPSFLCPQDPVLQVLLSADLEGFQHFPSWEEAGEALGCSPRTG